MMRFILLLMTSASLLAAEVSFDRDVRPILAAACLHWNIHAPEEVHHMGMKCLTARRLLERGVRFVQIWSANDNSFPRRNWDSHEDIERDHGALARGWPTRSPPSCRT